MNVRDTYTYGKGYEKASTHLDTPSHSELCPAIGALEHVRKHFSGEEAAAKVVAAGTQHPTESQNTKMNSIALHIRKKSLHGSCASIYERLKVAYQNGWSEHPAFWNDLK